MAERAICPGMKLCESIDAGLAETISAPLPRPNNPLIESPSVSKTPVARSFRGTISGSNGKVCGSTPNEGRFGGTEHSGQFTRSGDSCCHFHFPPTPASKSRTLGFHRRFVSHDPAGQPRPQVPLRTATARPTGFGYAHRPLRYPIRRRESRIITRGTPPGKTDSRTLSAQPSP